MIYVTTPAKIGLVPDSVSAADKVVLFYKNEDTVLVGDLDHLYSKAVPIIYLAVKTDSDILVCTGALCMQVSEPMTILDENIPSPATDITTKIKTMFEPAAEVSKPTAEKAAEAPSEVKEEADVFLDDPAPAATSEPKGGFHGSSLMRERSKLNSSVRSAPGRNMVNAIHEDADRIFSVPPGGQPHDVFHSEKS